MSDEQGSWAGCCLKGCLVVVILAIGIGYYVYVKTVQFARDSAASGIEFVVDKAVKDGMAPADAEKIKQTVSTFTAQIREGRISVRQGANVALSIGQSPIFFALMTRSFENRFVVPSELSPEEKQKAHDVIIRFSRGLLEDRIEKEKVNDVLEPLQEETERTRDGKKERRFKKKVSREELLLAISRMEEMANTAKIVEVVEIDLPAEIEKAIQKGLKD
jgi:hypothetical protein